MAYDPACEDLARHFLSDLAREDLAARLAQHIQDEVEAWIEWEIRTLSDAIAARHRGDGV